MSVEEPRTEQKADALPRTASSERGEADHLDGCTEDTQAAPFAGAPLDRDTTLGCWTSAADIAVVVYRWWPGYLRYSRPGGLLPRAPTRQFEAVHPPFAPFLALRQTRRPLAAKRLLTAHGSPARKPSQSERFSGNCSHLSHLVVPRTPNPKRAPSACAAKKGPENRPKDPSQSSHTQSRQLLMKWEGKFSVERQHFKKTSRFTERPQKACGRRPHGLRSAEQAACRLQDLSFHNKACLSTLSEKCKRGLRLSSVSLPTADTLLLVRDLRQGLRAKRSVLCCSRPARTSAPDYAGLPVQQAKPWDPSLSPVGVPRSSKAQRAAGEDMTVLHLGQKVQRRVCTRAITCSRRRRAFNLLGAG